MRATLQSDFSKSSIDREARVIKGVRVIENNRDVTYRGSDGKPKSFRTNDGLLTGLLSHAGDSIPSHLTHDWSEANRDPLHDRCGALKNFRMTEGALLADFHAIPGTNGDKALWLAENDPKNAALSAIFDYNPIASGDVTYAVPLNFQAADLVAKGAACSALLSKFTDTDMNEEQIKKLVTDSITAALANFKPAGYITEAEAEQRIKAALSAHKPESAKLSDDEIAKIAATAADAAETKVVAKLGVNAGLLANLKKGQDDGDKVTAKLAEYEKTAPNRAVAIRRMLADNPALGPAYEEYLQKEVAKLQNVA